VVPGDRDSPLHRTAQTSEADITALTSKLPLSCFDGNRRRKTVKVPGKAGNRKMESKTDFKLLPPGRIQQGNRKENRKLQL
jgi:hypothetical protein